MEQNRYQDKTDNTKMMKDKSKTDKIISYLILYALPFFYGAITRLPFIYFVIHMRFQFSLSWNEIGYYVGAYQASRVVVSMTTIPFPVLSHFFGTALGLAGSILVLVSDNDEMIPFLVGTISIGFSETLASSQTLLKNSPLFNNNLDLIGQKIKVQYASVMLGVTFAFALGGAVYQYFGINGIAIFGIIMSGFELLSLLCFVILEKMFPVVPDEQHQDNNNDTTTEKNKQAMDTEKAEDTSDASASEEGQEQEEEEVVGDCENEEQELVEETKNALDYFSNSGIGPNFVNFVLVITFGMESITIGYNLAISPVFILEEFHKNTTVIGIMLAAGAATGTLCTIAVTLTERGNKFMKRCVPAPYNLFVSLAGISMSVFTASIPSFPIHIIGLLLLMAFNDLAATILNEIQGSITSSKSYALVGPMGQVVRRTFNVVTAITGPLLFGMFPRLPYLVAGSVTGLWLIVLVTIIMRRMKKNQQKFLFSCSVHSVVDLYTSKMDFVEKEIIRRQMKRGTLSYPTTEEEDDNDDEEVVKCYDEEVAKC